MKKYLNQQDMKDRNHTNIFRLIRKKGPLTRRQIESETGLSWGAVSNVTARLIELGYVREIKDGENPAGTAGRTPILLEADGETHFIVGLDVNCSGFRAVLMNLQNRVLHTVQRTPYCGDRESLLSGIRETVREILDFADGKHVLCIGIAMQGTVDAANGVSVHFPRCKDWKDVPLCAMLEEEYGLPVFLEHDPDCILYAYSASAGLRDAILIRVDSGVGMAVMMNGRIFERLGAFELAHTVVTPDGAPCTCGNRGCLEAYASETGMAELAGIPFDELVQRAQRGDRAALGVFTQMADSLALAVGNVSRLLNIGEVVLCGDMLRHRELFYDRLSASAFRVAGEHRLSFSVTDVAEAASGGAMIALERYVLRLE